MIIVSTRRGILAPFPQVKLDIAKAEFRSVSASECGEARAAGGFPEVNGGVSWKIIINGGFSLALFDYPILTCPENTTLGIVDHTSKDVGMEAVVAVHQTSAAVT